MTSPTLSDALRIVAAGGHVADEPGLLAASAWQLDTYAAVIDQLVTDLARRSWLTTAEVLVTVGPHVAQIVTERGLQATDGAGGRYTGSHQVSSPQNGRETA